MTFGEGLVHLHRQAHRRLFNVDAGKETVMSEEFNRMIDGHKDNSLKSDDRLAQVYPATEKPKVRLKCFKRDLKTLVDLHDHLDECVLQAQTNSPQLNRPYAYIKFQAIRFSFFGHAYAVCTHFCCTFPLTFLFGKAELKLHVESPL